MASSLQPCSTTSDMLCPDGQACYVQEDGYFCKSNGTDGCIIADSSIKYVNGQLVDLGGACQHCPVPNTLKLRELFKSRLSNIVQDQGWHTYGNCRFGFCSLDGTCKSLKKPYSLCLTSDQCSIYKCERLSARDNQFACPDGYLGTYFLGHLIIGLWLFILGLGCISITFCRIRRQKKDFQMQQQQFTEQASQADSHNALVNPIKRHRRKMFSRYAWGVAGVGFIITAGLYGFLPPTVFQLEDEN